MQIFNYNNLFVVFILNVLPLVKIQLPCLYVTPDGHCLVVVDINSAGEVWKDVVADVEVADVGHVDRPGLDILENISSEEDLADIVEVKAGPGKFIQLTVDDRDGGDVPGGQLKRSAAGLVRHNEVTD